jgi:hypothetical protein
MKILIVSNENSLSNHLQDILKDFDTKKMFPNREGGDYDINLHGDFKITETFDQLIFIVDYNDFGFNINMEESWENFVSSRMFESIFTNMFHVLTKISFKKITFISSKYANNIESFYGFLYKKAEEIIEWYAAFNKKEYTIFRLYDLIGSKSKYKIDGGSLNALFMTAANTNKIFYSDQSYQYGDHTEPYRPVHVIDACNAIKNSLLVPSNQVEHLCDINIHTITELIDLFETVNFLKLERIVIPKPHVNTDYLSEHKPSKFLLPVYKPEDWVKIRKKESEMSK